MISYESKCAEFMLNEKNDLKIHLFYQTEVKSNKKYLTNISIVIDKNVIINNVANAFKFKEELKLFNANDEQSCYFKIVQRQLKNDKVNSLKLIHEKLDNIYFSKSDANAIVSLFNLSLNGYILSKLASVDITDAYNLALEDMFS